MLVAVFFCLVVCRSLLDLLGLLCLLDRFVLVSWLLGRVISYPLSWIISESVNSGINLEQGLGLVVIFIVSNLSAQLFYY